MQHLLTLRVFVAVAEAGGFAAAARQLGLSPPAVTRAITGLEGRLDTALLVRTTRSVRLTEVGEQFLSDCRRILTDLDEAEATARGARREPQGQLAVTAPSMFGRMHVLPIVAAFLAQHARVDARVYFVDRIVHLIDEGFDVGIRFAAELPDSRLTAITVGSMRRVIVAAPAYLAAHGEPTTPAALESHLMIGIARDGHSPGRGGYGMPLQSAPAPGIRRKAVPRLIVNTPEVAVAAAVQGQGLTWAFHYQAAEDLTAGRLQVVLARFEPPPVPLHLVYPAGRKAAAKVRGFIDFAAAQLRRSEVLV